MYEKYQLWKISLQCRGELNQFFLTCNVTRKYFIALSRNVTQLFRYITLFSLRYVTFRLQIPGFNEVWYRKLDIFEIQNALQQFIPNFYPIGF
jgi:hypothetical protein